MKFSKFFLSVAAFGLLSLGACSDDKKSDDPGKNPDGPGGSGSMEVMTPEESKKFLESAVTKALDMFNPEDQKEVIEVAAYFEEEYGDLELPDNFYFDEDDDLYEPKSFMKGLASACRGNMEGLTRAAYTYTYDINFDKLKGVYEPDLRNDCWKFVEKSNDVIFRFYDKNSKQSEIKVTRSGGSSDFTITEEDNDEYWDEYEKYIYNISIPHTVEARLSVGGKQLAYTKVVSSIDIDGHKLSADVYAEAANLTASAKLEGNDSKVASTTRFTVGGKDFLTGYATVNGAGLCDYDKIKGMLEESTTDREWANFIQKGDAGVNLIGEVQVYAQANVTKDVVAAFRAGEWDSYEYNSKSEARADAEAAVRALNQNIAAQMRYNDTKTDQATIVFELEEDTWSYGWEYTVGMYLKFGDGTTYSFDDYFKHWTSVETKWNSLMRAYERVWEGALPK